MYHKTFSRFTASRTVRSALLLLACGAAIPALRAQSDSAPDVAPPRNGFRLRGLSAYVVYSSNGLPNSSTGTPSIAAKLPSDVGQGGSASIEWIRFTERSTFSLNYTPSYTGRARYSELNAFNQSFDFTATRSISSRTGFSLAVRSDYTSLEQSLFSGTTLGNVAAVSASFDDLSSGVLTSRSINNPALNNVLSSVPVQDSPVRALLYGQRMFNTTAQISVSHAITPRLTLSLRGGGSRLQHISQSTGLASLNLYLLPSTSSGNAGALLSYALSSATQIGASVNTLRVSSALQDVYTSTTLATFGRTLGRRWFIQLHGGAGFSTPVRQTFVKVSEKPQPSAGGTVGFKTGTNTFLGTVDRTVSDSYGVGAAVSTSANGSWLWRRPGNAWSWETSGGWQQLEGNTLATTLGWNASTGLNRGLGRHMALHMQYTFLHNSGKLQGSAFSRDQSAVRVSLEWFPGGNPAL